MTPHLNAVLALSYQTQPTELWESGHISEFEFQIKPKLEKLVLGYMKQFKEK